MRRLVPRDTAGSVEELLAGASDREPLGGTDGKSGARLERVVIDGEPHVLKHLHVDDDWTMRGFGDLCCRPVRLWEIGLLDAVGPSIDHGVVGAVRGLGRHGWGGALLMRDVGADLFPEGDEPISADQHRRLLDHLAQLSSEWWQTDEPALDLLPLSNRYSAFGPGWLAVEEQLGWPDAVPPIAADGWRRFEARAPEPVRASIRSLRSDPSPLVAALERTPRTFLHGDWKLGNLGATPEGRTVLLDWTYPGIGPVLHELGWHLALNRARLPESKESTIEAFRAALEVHGVATAGWWDEQLELCLLGTLVQFGWEKALGDEDELAWWTAQAERGLTRL